MDQKNEVSSRPREEPEKQVDGCTRIGTRISRRRILLITRRARGRDDTTYGRGTETRLRQMAVSRGSGQNQQLVVMTSGRVASTQF